MLEDLYLGSKPPKEEYMDNFSEEEKVVFRTYIQEKQAFSEQVRSYLARQVADGCSMEFKERHDPKASTALDIKYALNRIAANDPHALDFSLSKVDANVIENPDRLALDIAKAFRGNTHCKYVTLNGIGLTDNGMVPILRSLPLELHELDIAGNNITDKSVEVVSTRLASSENKWQAVNLGKIQVTPGQEKVLARYPNLYFESTTSSPSSLETKSPDSDGKCPLLQVVRHWFQR